jgi:hypothetical protein
LLNKIIDWFSNLGTNENNSSDEGIVFYTSKYDVKEMFEKEKEAHVLVCFSLSDEGCQDNDYYTKIKIIEMKEDSDEE